jgi:hypothetical protein
VWAAELIHLARPAPLLDQAGGIALLAFVILAWLRATSHIRVLFPVIAGAAAVLAAATGQLHELMVGFQKSAAFGAFLASVLLLRATVEASPRLERLRGGVEGLEASAAQNWTLYGAHALGSVLSVGAMSILAPVAAANATTGMRAALASNAARGVGTAVMWSPFFVAIAFSTQLVPGVATWQVMAIGTGLAALGLLLSQRLFTPALDVAGFRASVMQLGPLVLPVAVLVASVVAASTAFHLNGVQAVAFVIPLLCMLYGLSLGLGSARHIARRAFRSFSGLSDELLIVLGSTVLATVVSAMPAVKAMGTGFVPGLVAGPILIALLVFLLVALGQVGLHPMIGSGIALPVLASGGFGIAPPILVATGVFAWGLSSAISLWTLPVVAASVQFAVPVRELLTRRTLAFGVLHALCGVTYLAIVNALLLP